MTRLSWPLASAAEMRALDHYSIETLGVPGDVLMESAGRAVAQGVLEELAPDASVCVVCGTGNNGGDGLVVARQLHLLGVRVGVAMLGDAAGLSTDAARNLERARETGVRIEGADCELPQRGVVVDAIFGTGLSREVSGLAAEWIQRINDARGRARGMLRVLSVDLPSGLSADTGQVLGAVVTADSTLAIGLPKLGLLLEPGRSCAGAVRVARIGIADQAPDTICAAESLTRAGAGAGLPSRPREGHKGSFGHALIVAGSAGKSGAAALAAVGAGRMGAGLVSVACP
ncbi:MAG: NAD(P)H-hydrate epimerase, partial [Myxococcota bacterium]